jgi:hypothetical protein
MDVQMECSPLMDRFQKAVLLQGRHHAQAGIKPSVRGKEKDFRPELKNWILLGSPEKNGTSKSVGSCPVWFSVLPKGS